MDVAPTIAVLERAGYRLTEPRRRLAALIDSRDGHFTAGDLIAEARDRRLRIGRATVFRTLEVLEELGSVEHLDLPSGDHAYVACRRSHHHHIVCSSCGQADEIDDAGLRVVVGEIARRTGYRVDEHRLELFGLCPSCLANARQGATMPGGS